MNEDFLHHHQQRERESKKTQPRSSNKQRTGSSQPANGPTLPATTTISGRQAQQRSSVCTLRGPAKLSRQGASIRPLILLLYCSIISITKGTPIRQEAAPGRGLSELHRQYPPVTMGLPMGFRFPYLCRCFLFLVVSSWPILVTVRAWTAVPSVRRNLPLKTFPPNAGILGPRRPEASLCLSVIQGTTERYTDDAPGSDEPSEFSIRDGQYGELIEVVDIIMRSFYNTTSDAWCLQLYRMAELNRLQQGFPYADTRGQHRMFVAVSKADDTNRREGKEKIVGFCDIDIRAPNRPTQYAFNPRPYLSDLCIDPDWRRRGVARKLIQACEEFCVKMKKNEVYIRVERSNEAGLKLYRGLGYDEIERRDSTDGKLVILNKLLDTVRT